MLSVSENGLDLIRQFESFENEAYLCPANVWTIGFGHTEGVKPGDKISYEEANELLRKDVQLRVNALNNWCAEHRVELNQNEFDALVSFIFNVGTENFRSKSSVAKALKRGDKLTAGAKFGLWNKATVNGALVELRGLTRRRTAEALLFLTPVEGEPPNNPARPTFDPNEISNLKPGDVNKIQ